MKKSNLFLVILMALIVMSCSKDETTMSIPQESNAIEFGTYVGRDAQTRASIIDIDGLKGTATDYADGKGFGVFAYYTGQSDWAEWLTANPDVAANFMFNQAVKWDGTNWKYSPVKYWPNNKVGETNHERVSFFAYAPYNLGGDNAPTFSGSTLTFEVKSVVTDQIDLLWNSTIATDLEKQTVGAKVPFNFKHALSRIGFNVRAVVDEVAAGTNAIDENTTITVNKVVLCKSVDINYGGTDTDITGAFYQTGKLDLNRYDETVTEPGSATWTGKDGTQSFTLTPTDNFKNEAVTLTSATSTDFQQLNDDDSYVMIIPQNFSDNAFTVYIEYEVTTTDTDTTNGAANSSTITNKIATPVKINFESGKAYALNLQLGMTSVKLDATVTGWINATDTDVDVPINTTTP